MISLQSEENLATMNDTASTNSSTNNYYEDYLTPTDNGLNIEVNNLDVNCITSKNNTFNIDSEGNITCNSILVNNQNSNLNFDSIYPIGSIYMSVNDINPNVLFEGTTWEKITDRFLMGAGNKYSLGSTGGVENHTHTSAAHSHTSAAHSHGAGNLAAAINFEAQTGIYTRWTTACGAFQATGLKQAKEVVNSSSSSRSEATVVYGTTASATPGATGTTTPGNTGSSSNIPPYLAINIWKRVS